VKLINENKHLPTCMCSAINCETTIYRGATSYQIGYCFSNHHPTGNYLIANDNCSPIHRNDKYPIYRRSEGFNNSVRPNIIGAASNQHANVDTCGEPNSDATVIYNYSLSTNYHIKTANDSSSDYNRRISIVDCATVVYNYPARYYHHAKTGIDSSTG
jgi:hypothetical protein